MKNRIVKTLKYTVLTTIMVVSMTGCGNKIPELTEEQVKQVGEYAAVTLLKYDKNSQSRLVDVATVEAYDQKQKELKELQEVLYKDEKEEAEGMKPVDDTPVKEKNEATAPQETIMSLEENFALSEGITINYTGYESCDSYPEDGSANAYFALDASEGKKLLVMEFEVKNTSATDQELNFFSKTAVFTVDLGDGKKLNSMTTMLMNDMSTYVGTIPAGESQEMVLLFEIEEGAAENISELKLYLKNDANKYTILL